MTAKIPEKMTYEGISYDMISEPLYSVLSRKKIATCASCQGRRLAGVVMSVFGRSSKTVSF